MKGIRSSDRQSDPFITQVKLESSLDSTSTLVYWNCLLRLVSLVYFWVKFLQITSVTRTS